MGTTYFKPRNADFSHETPQADFDKPVFQKVSDGTGRASFSFASEPNPDDFVVSDRGEITTFRTVLGEVLAGAPDYDGPIYVSEDEDGRTCAVGFEV